LDSQKGWNRPSCRLDIRFPPRRCLAQGRPSSNGRDQPFHTLSRTFRPTAGPRPSCYPRRELYPNLQTSALRPACATHAPPRPPRRPPRRRGRCPRRRRPEGASATGAAVATRRVCAQTPSAKCRSRIQGFVPQDSLAAPPQSSRVSARTPPAASRRRRRRFQGLLLCSPEERRRFAAPPRRSLPAGPRGFAQTPSTSWKRRIQSSCPQGSLVAPPADSLPQVPPP